MAAVWIDAHLSPGLSHWFCETLAIDAIAVHELGLRDAEDLVIFEQAREARAIVLTKGRDFVSW